MMVCLIVFWLVVMVIVLVWLLWVMENRLVLVLCIERLKVVGDMGVVVVRVICNFIEWVYLLWCEVNMIGMFCVFLLVLLVGLDVMVGEVVFSVL